MADFSCLPHYFLGANTAVGFVEFFSKNYLPRDKWRAFLIKGGPGTGKSTLMKKAAEAAMDAGVRVSLSPCTSDPASLDAVILPDLRILIADGTAPHVLEPQYPGVCEAIVNLGDCYDRAALFENGGDVFRLCDQNAALHRRAARYISTAALLLQENAQIAAAHADLSKTVRFAARTAAQWIPDCKTQGVQWPRYLSGITPQGYLFFEQTLSALCDDRVVFSDPYGAVAPACLQAVLEIALARGHEAVVCMSPFAPRQVIEHVVLPDLRLAFCTENRWMRHETYTRRIHARRFCDVPALRAKKQQLSFNRRAARELIDGAADLLAQAKQVHDEIERYYIRAMDFQKADLICARLLAELF